MAESAHGDGRSIENPIGNSDELDEAVRSDADNQPVEGETADDVGSDGETVSQAGEGLVAEEGVNERGTAPEPDTPPH